jgi:hypothetical protein
MELLLVGGFGLFLLLAWVGVKLYKGPPQDDTEPDGESLFSEEPYLSRVPQPGSGYGDFSDEPEAEDERRAA